MTKKATSTAFICLLALPIFLGSSAFAGLTRPEMDIVTERVQKGDQSVLGNLEYKGKPVESDGAYSDTLIDMLNQGDQSALTDDNLTFNLKPGESIHPTLIKKFKDHLAQRLRPQLCATGVSNPAARKICVSAGTGAGKADMELSNFVAECMLEYRHCSIHSL